MNWITIIWSATAGICMTLAGVQLLVWLRAREFRVNLPFSLWAATVACSAAFELAMMYARTPEQYGEFVRWIHLPLGVATVSYVWFASSYLGAGRRWLLWSIYFLAVLQMTVNFASHTSAHFSEITALNHVPFLGEQIAVPVGVTSSWKWIGRIGAMLILLFIIDAAIAAWRKDRHRRAVLMGLALLTSSVGSIVLSGLFQDANQSAPIIVSLPSLVAILVVAFDLSSDLVRAQKSLRELADTRQRMSLAISAAGLGVWDWDIARDEVWASETIRTRFGFGQTERINLERFLQSLHPEDREPTRRVVREAVKDGREFQSEYRVNNAQGGTRWIAARGKVELGTDGKPLRMRGVSTDITERKQAEARENQLQAYRNMGHEILRILSDPRDFQDAMKHILVALKTSTGVDAVGIRLQDKENFPYLFQDGFSDEFLNKENSLLKRERDGGICRDSNGKVCLECTCGLVISGGTDPSSPFFTAGGSAWINDSSSLLELPSHQDPRTNPRNECIHQGYASIALVPIRAKGQIIGLLQLNDRRKGRFTREAVETLEGLAENIGEALLRKRAEVEAQELRRDLAHVQRATTMGQLASALAHELNQPLGAILRNAEAGELFLQQDPPDLEELRAILTDIRQDDQRAGAVIDRMRSLLKRRDLRFERISLRELLDQVLVVIQAEMQAHQVALQVELPSDLPPVRGDRVHLQQVLLNLLVNGMDAMEDTPSERRRLAVQFQSADGQTIEVAVSDNGGGISAEKLAHVFTPFFTTKSKGLGMGLPISQTIIESHGGRIWAENRPEGGATFRFTLKVASGEGQASGDAGRGTGSEGRGAKERGMQ